MKPLLRCVLLILVVALLAYTRPAPELTTRRAAAITAEPDPWVIPTDVRTFGGEIVNVTDCGPGFYLFVQTPQEQKWKVFVGPHTELSTFSPHTRPSLGQARKWVAQREPGSTAFCGVRDGVLESVIFSPP